MITVDDDDGSSQQPALPVWKPGLWRVSCSAALVLLSLVSSVTVRAVEFAGGATLAALAALILFWPLVPQLWARGGQAEFLGLKIKLDALERRSEQEVGVRIEELSADMESLRLQVEGLSGGRETASLQPIAAGRGSARSLADAVTQYNSYPETKQWNERIAVDKRLIAAGPFEVSVLRDALSAAPGDRETAMAVAVALGSVQPGADESDAVDVLVNLLNNPAGRVRYRAARSMTRLLRRLDLQAASRRSLIDGARRRADVEKNDGVRGELLGVMTDHE